MAQDIREFISNVGRTSEIVIKLCRAVMSLGGGLEDIKILLQEKHDEDFVKMAKILLGMADIEEYTSDHVALHARCSEIRLRAIKEVSSESTLATIATTDPIKEIRRAAIKRIKNEDILFDVVSKGYSSF